MSIIKNKVYDEILNEYLKTHKKISRRQLEEIKSNILKNIDIDVYESLKQFDEEKGYTNKKDQYLNIMLRHYKRKIGESNKDYESRVSYEKEKLLKSYNINVDAISKRKNLKFKAFGKNAGINSIRVSNKEKATKNMKKAKEKALKSPKNFVNEILNKFKPSKIKFHISAPKGFFNKLKEKKEKNPTKFKKSRLKALITAGILSLAIGSAAIVNYNFTTNNKETTKYSTETEYDKTSNKESNKPKENSTLIPDSETLQEENKLENPLKNIQEPNDIEVYFEDIEEENNSKTEDSKEEDSSKKETQSKDSSTETKTENKKESTKKTETEKSDNNSNKNSSKTVKKVSIESVINSILTNSPIGFNTEFKMSEGLFYETPEGIGNYGSYHNHDDSNLKLTYINAMYEDGSYKQYNVNDGLSIAEIISKNPGAKLSYHVETTDGNILRMEFSLRK